MSIEFPDWTLPSLVVHLPQEGHGIQEFTTRSPNRRYLISYVSNQIAGVLMENPVDGQIVGFVFPEYRMRGIGSKLWAEGVEQWDLEQPEELSADAEAFFAALNDK